MGEAKKLQKRFPHKSKQECKAAIKYYGGKDAAAQIFQREAAGQSPTGTSSQTKSHHQPVYAQPAQPAYQQPMQQQPYPPPQQLPPQQQYAYPPPQPGQHQQSHMPNHAHGAAAAPVKASGTRRALLIGCNYRGTRAQLNGCVDDVKQLSNLLVNVFGWKYNEIRIMTDDTQQCPPTKKNIIDGMRWLVADAKPGDYFFFSFSGHGAQKPDPNGFEEDGMNETLLPLDFQKAGMISDDEVNALLVQTIPNGAKLTAVLDACHSGTGLDLPFTWTNHGWQEETNPLHTVGDVQMWSGCSDADVSSDGGRGLKGGAMTNAFCAVLTAAPHLTYPQLLASLHQTLAKYGFRQRPVLTSSQPFDFRRPFSLDEILPNMNPYIGRIFRRRFKSKPNKHSQKFMKDIGLGGAVGAMVGLGAGLLLLDALF